MSEKMTNNKSPKSRGRPRSAKEMKVEIVWPEGFTQEDKNAWRESAAITMYSLVAREAMIKALEEQGDKVGAERMRGAEGDAAQERIRRSLQSKRATPQFSDKTKIRSPEALTQGFAVVVSELRTTKAPSALEAADLLESAVKKHSAYAVAKEIEKAVEKHAALLERLKRVRKMVIAHYIKSCLLDGLKVYLESTE